MNRRERRKRMVMGFGATVEQEQKLVAETFQGELMKCVLCGKEQKSDPNIHSDWRVVEVDGRRFYACREEFPADGATEEQFYQAYKRFMERAIKVMKAN